MKDDSHFTSYAFVICLSNSGARDTTLYQRIHYLVYSEHTHNSLSVCLSVCLCLCVSLCVYMSVTCRHVMPVKQLVAMETPYSSAASATVKLVIGVDGLVRDDGDDGDDDGDDDDDQ